jgi:integrase
MHELRHSAADNFWRAMLAKELLRHRSVATTQVYLHADRSDPEQARVDASRAFRPEGFGLTWRLGQPCAR